MNSYELIVVFKQDLQPSVISDESKKIENIISSNDSKLIESVNWGRKEIAYIPGRFAEGIFHCYTFSTENNQAVSMIESLLRINENVRKFQTYKTSIPLRKFKGNPKAKYTADTEEDYDLESDYLV